MNCKSSNSLNCYSVSVINPYISDFGWIRASINLAGCGSYQIQKNVWVGPPTKPNKIYNFLEDGIVFSSYTQYQFSVWPEKGLNVIGYEWEVEGGNIEYGQGTYMITVTTDMVGSLEYADFKVRVRYEDQCGFGQWFERTGYIEGGTIRRLEIAPNPATIEVTISELEPTNDNIPWVLRLMSQQGAVMVSVSSTLPETINVTGLQPGTYILHGRQGQYVEQQLVIIQ